MVQNLIQVLRTDLARSATLGGESRQFNRLPAHSIHLLTHDIVAQDRSGKLRERMKRDLTVGRNSLTAEGPVEEKDPCHIARGDRILGNATRFDNGSRSGVVGG